MGVLRHMAAVRSVMPVRDGEAESETRGTVGLIEIADCVMCCKKWSVPNRLLKSREWVIALTHNTHAGIRTYTNTHSH